MATNFQGLSKPSLHSSTHIFGIFQNLSHILPTITVATKGFQAGLLISLSIVDLLLSLIRWKSACKHSPSLSNTGSTTVHCIHADICYFLWLLRSLVKPSPDSITHYLEIFRNPSSSDSVSQNVSGWILDQHQHFCMFNANMRELRNNTSWCLYRM